MQDQPFNLYCLWLEAITKYSSFALLCMAISLNCTCVRRWFSRLIYALIMFKARVTRYAIFVSVTNLKNGTTQIMIRVIPKVNIGHVPTIFPAFKCFCVGFCFYHRHEHHYTLLPNNLDLKGNLSEQF